MRLAIISLCLSLYLTGCVSIYRDSQAPATVGSLFRENSLLDATFENNATYHSKDVVETGSTRLSEVFENFDKSIAFVRLRQVNPEQIDILMLRADRTVLRTETLRKGDGFHIEPDGGLVVRDYSHVGSGEAGVGWTAMSVRLFQGEGDSLIALTTNSGGVALALVVPMYSRWTHAALFRRAP